MVVSDWSDKGEGCNFAWNFPVDQGCWSNSVLVRSCLLVESSRTSVLPEFSSLFCRLLFRHSCNEYITYGHLFCHYFFHHFSLSVCDLSEVPLLFGQTAVELWILCAVHIVYIYTVKWLWLQPIVWCILVLCVNCQARLSEEEKRPHHRNQRNREISLRRAVLCEPFARLLMSKWISFYQHFFHYKVNSTPCQSALLCYPNSAHLRFSLKPEETVSAFVDVT